MYTYCFSLKVSKSYMLLYYLLSCVALKDFDSISNNNITSVVVIFKISKHALS